MLAPSLAIHRVPLYCHEPSGLAASRTSSGEKRGAIPRNTDSARQGVTAIRAARKARRPTGRQRLPKRQPNALIGSGSGRKSKAIVLFADGTGNSEAAVFKRNVRRMYEAVDAGPAPPEKRPQVSYYDSGVGTSRLRGLALLGGDLWLGPETERAGHVPVCLPQLSCGRRSVCVWLQPRRLHRSPGCLSYRLPGTGAIAQ
jgi:hypothetical protein